MSEIDYILQDARLAALQQTEVAVTGATTLDATAFGKMHKCTGTTYTVTLPSPTSQERKVIGINNAASGNITVAGTMAPSTDTVIAPGEVLFLICDGTKYYTQKEKRQESLSASGSSGDEAVARSWFGI